MYKDFPYFPENYMKKAKLNDANIEIYLVFSLELFVLLQ